MAFSCKSGKVKHPDAKEGIIMEKLDDKFVKGSAFVRSQHPETFPEITTYPEELLPSEMHGRLGRRFIEGSAFARSIPEVWVPPVDVLQSKDSFFIKLELPGMDEEDVQVRISGELLIIKGEKKKEAEDQEADYYRTERYYGSFKRVFQLPIGVSKEKVDAIVDKGVLKIELPKLEEAKKEEFEIKIK